MLLFLEYYFSGRFDSFCFILSICGIDNIIGDFIAAVLSSSVARLLTITKRRTRFIKMLVLFKFNKLVLIISATAVAVGSIFFIACLDLGAMVVLDCKV